jgi:putative transposase
VSVTASHVKRAFKYRFYPTDAQAAEVSRTFGWRPDGPLQSVELV